MSNMSYCRFENTLHDLRDCEDHLDDDISEKSDIEIRSRTALIKLCQRIAENYGED